MKEKLFEEARNLYQKFINEKDADVSSKYFNEFYGMIKAIEIMGYDKDWKNFCEKYGDIIVCHIDKSVFHDFTLTQRR